MRFKIRLGETVTIHAPLLMGEPEFLVRPPFDAIQLGDALEDRQQQRFVAEHGLAHVAAKMTNTLKMTQERLGQRARQ